MFIKNKKGGVFFTLDATIAAIILLMTATVLLSFSSSGPVTSDARAQLVTFTDYVFNNQMRDLQESVFGSQDIEKYGDLYVHEMIVEMELDQSKDPHDLITSLDNLFIPDSYGISYNIGSEQVYYREREPFVEPSINLSSTFLTYYILEDEDKGPYEVEVRIWN